MKKIIYRIWSKILTFLGDITWSGWNRPFWFVINHKEYELKGKHFREVSKIIQPGDVVIQRYEGYVDKWFIPGFWNHGGLYVGEFNGQPQQVVHAISDGVICEDLIDFMRTDHMIVLRPPSYMSQSGVQLAISLIGKEYDFVFDFRDRQRFSCTEVVDYCYKGLAMPRKGWFKTIIVADDIVASKILKVVWQCY